MRRSTSFATLLFIVSLTGCAAEPFTRGPLPPLNDSNPQKIQTDFAKTLPDRFTAEDTILIHAPFIDSMAILSVVQINRTAGEFEMVGLTQTGVELFHIAGDHGGAIIRSAVPPLMAHRKVLMAIAHDIERIYFDLTPPTTADVQVCSTKVTFTTDTPPGAMVYEFGENPPVLLDKHLQDCLGALWRVRYFDYAMADGTLYPRGIVLDNDMYHYQIVVKNRSRTADK